MMKNRKRKEKRPRKRDKNGGYGEGHGAFQAPDRTQPAQQRSCFLGARDNLRLGPSRQHIISRPSEEHVDLESALPITPVESALSTPVESDLPIP
jgi:hypothetical protein